MAPVAAKTAKKRAKIAYKDMKTLGIIKSGRSKQEKKTKALRQSINQTNSRLFTLPAEIRNRIYRLVVLRNEKTVVTPRTIKPGLPALLRTCQQIYGEAGSIYFGENKFTLAVAHSNKGFPAFTNQMRSFFGDRGKGRKKPLRYDCGAGFFGSRDAFDKWDAQYGVFL